MYKVKGAIHVDVSGQRREEIDTIRLSWGGNLRVKESETHRDPADKWRERESHRERERESENERA